MSLVFMDSFDIYNGTGANTGLQAKWIISNGFYSPQILSPGRIGGQGFRIYNEGSAIYRSWPTPNNAFTVAHAFRIEAGLTSLAPASTIRALTTLCGGGSSANPQIGWKPNGDGSVSVYRLTSHTTGTLLGTSATGVVISGQWQWFDLSGTIDPTTGTVIMKVDGTTVINLTGVNTQGYSTTTVDGVILGSQGGGILGGQAANWDDIYVLDTAVTLGERRIEVPRPSADTATKQWTPDTGTVNYSRVNETLADTANYVQAVTNGLIDLYDMADLSSSPATIDAVQLTCFANKTDAGAKTIKLVGDIGGTQILTPDFVLLTGVNKFEAIMTSMPGGGAWTPSAVNSLRVGPKVTS